MREDANSLCQVWFPRKERFDQVRCHRPSSSKISKYFHHAEAVDPKKMRKGAKRMVAQVIGMYKFSAKPGAQMRF